MLFYALAIALLLFTFVDGKITLLESIMFVVFYMVYILVLKYWKGFVNYKEEEDGVLLNREDHTQKTQKKKLKKITNSFDRFLGIFSPQKNIIILFLGFQ